MVNGFNYKIGLILVFCCLLLSSCFDVVEDVTIKNNGSGKCRYILNASKSKTKLNGMFMVDSLAKNKLPSKSEIQARAEEYITELKKQKGISEVVFKLDWSQYTAELSFDFASIKELNEALYALQKKGDKEGKAPPMKEVFQFNGATFKRVNAPDPPAEEKKKLEAEMNKNIDLLRQAKFISIFRFDKEIEKVSNPAYKVAANGKAAMMQVTMHNLSKQEKVENTIILKK
jgi:hypothetical protein